MPGENGKEENMGFETFTDTIVDLLQERMGDAYEIKVIRVTKNNDVELTGIALTRQEDSIFPTIYRRDSMRNLRRERDSVPLRTKSLTAMRSSQWRWNWIWIFFAILTG